MSETLRFLADMNISPLTVEALQRAGWNIVRVSNLIPTQIVDVLRQHNAVTVDERTVRIRKLPIT